jgi:hypothetical protein
MLLGMSLGEPLRQVKAIRRAEPGAEDHALSEFLSAENNSPLAHTGIQKKLEAVKEPSVIGE